MPKIECQVYSYEDFFYGEKKDQPACTLWIAVASDPRPLRITVFGRNMVDKAHAYASAKKAVLTIAGNNQLNPVVTLVQYGEVKIYGTYLCTLPDAAAIDMAFALAYVWFHRTGSFADVTATHTRTKEVYKPSDEIRSGLQISIENWHSSCNINK